MEKSNLKQDEEQREYQCEDSESSSGCGCFRVFRFKTLRISENDNQVERRQVCGETTALSWLGRVREFSEVIAGPKWKNFIRKVGGYFKGTKKLNKARFHYDPQSYALNFDSGIGRDEEEEEEEEESYVLLR